MINNKLDIAVLNLMPAKEVTESQIKNLFTQAACPFKITWLTTASYKSTHTQEAYLKNNYTTFENIKNKHFDIFIITGAPIEHLRFEDVAYWTELTEILNFTRTNSLFNIFICWGAQAALYHFHGINKINLGEKCFGIFEQNIENKNSLFYRGFGDSFNMPHSRHTSIKREEIETNKNLVIEASFGKEISTVSSFDSRDLFITGHPEYDADTLHLEYKRDLQKGLRIKPPFNYYPQNDNKLMPPNTWKHDAVKFYTNIVKHVLNLKVYKELKNEKFQYSNSGLR